MTRALAAALLCVVVCALPALAAQPPNVVSRESVVTAKVDRIERGSKVVTLRGDASQILSVYVDPTVMSIDELHVGDLVTVKYQESLVVQVRANAELQAPHDTTAEAKDAGGRAVVEQQKTVVTIESIDSQGQFVTYRNADGLKAVRAVNDTRLLRGIHPGDRVEVTLTRERAISIVRAK
jgi:hypothetical protein